MPLPNEAVVIFDLFTPGVDFHTSSRRKRVMPGSAMYLPLFALLYAVVTFICQESMADPFVNPFVKSQWLTPSSISKFDYTYDAEGEIMSWTLEGAAPAAPQTYQFQYDVASQLIDAVLTGSNTTNTYSYAYDAAGNRLSESSGHGSASVPLAVVGASYNNESTRQCDGSWMHWQICQESSFDPLERFFSRLGGIRRTSKMCLTFRRRQSGSSRRLCSAPVSRPRRSQ
jgi:hypothetical protein